MERSKGTNTSAAAASPPGTAYVAPTVTSPTAREDGAPTTAGGGERDQPRASETVEAENVEVRADGLMNANYHSSREAFLDASHRWFMFGIIALGAAAIVDLAPKDWVIVVKECAAASAVLLAALDLTFDLSNRARAHSLMKRRYFELLAEMSEGRKSAAEARACMNRFSADEEPVYNALLIASWNTAQETAHGDMAQKYVIPHSHLLLKNLWRFAGSEYKTEKPA